MKPLFIANLLAVVAFGICAALSAHKASVLETFLAANHAGFSEATVLAFKACLDAWSATAACSGVAAVVAVVNLRYGTAKAR